MSYNRYRKSPRPCASYISCQIPEESDSVCYNCGHLRRHHQLTVQSLVKGGKIHNKPFGGLFRHWLRGRKPSVILAFYWLHYAEGKLFSLQASIKPTAKPSVKSRCFDLDLYLGKKVA